MPNLLTQDVHTYITELLSEILGPEESYGASAQSCLSLSLKRISIHGG